MATFPTELIQANGRRKAKRMKMYNDGKGRKKT